MKSLRLSTIGLAACAALVVSAIALTVMSAEALASHPNDPTWYSLFGLAVHHVAEAFTPAPSWNSAGSERQHLSARLYGLAYALACVLFTAAYWLRTRGVHRRAVVGTALLAIQLVIGVTVESSLLYILAAELAIALPARRAAGWLAAMIAGHLAQSAAMIAGAGLPDAILRFQVMNVAGEAVFYLFAFGVAKLAHLEQLARKGLAASNAELLATQALLADTVRTSERLRIARELHDSIGHHLTALNLHLDLADRQLAGANASLRTARELARELLGEVRVVVSAERDESTIDLPQSLRTLCDGIPAPAIRLQVAEDLRVASAATAHALFRCVQEAISNALRHADARHIDVGVARRGAAFVATVRDDGRGARGNSEGNGLAGMRERARALGGELRAGDAAAGGFQIELSLPVLGGTR
jgi:signal transduction histidine kinase